MSTTSPCPICGAPIPSDAPGGHCPACLIKDNFREMIQGTTVRYFGDYELQSKIAEGGMGVVWRARQISLNKKVAIKMIKTGQLDSAAVARFRTEAEAMAQLDHPNIVPIYEVGEHEGQQYFSMRLVEGHDLAQEIGGKPLPPRRAAELLATVARAVHHAHQRSVLHRDLKPSNILLEKSEAGPTVPNVTDFGLAKLVDQTHARNHTASVAIMGTFEYMAPEQAEGKTKYLTTAADIYSLGAILYAMLTGRPPFQQQTDGQADEGHLAFLRRVAEAAPPRPRAINHTCDRDLEAICIKCLEKEQDDRYGSAEALANDLDLWLKGEPVSPRPVPTWRRIAMWAKRRPAVAALGASLIVAVLAGLLSATVLWRRAEVQHRQAEKERSQAEDLAELLLTQFSRDVGKGTWLTEKSDFATSQTLQQIVEKATVISPDNSQWQLLRALSQRIHGNLLASEKDWVGAQRAYEQSLAASRRLMAEDPGDTRYQESYANTLVQMGALFDSKADFDEALRAYLDLLKFSREAAAKYPQRVDWQAGVAVSHRNIYRQLASKGRFEEALLAMKDALAASKREATLRLATGAGKLDLLKFEYPYLAESAELRRDVNGTVYVNHEMINEIERRIAEGSAEPGFPLLAVQRQVAIGRALNLHGQRREALNEYTQAMALAEKLRVKDEGVLRDIRARINELAKEK